MPEDFERMLDQLLKGHNREEFELLFESAIDKWLDKKFLKASKWAIGGMLAAVFVWVLKIYISSGGLK